MDKIVRYALNRYPTIGCMSCGGNKNKNKFFCSLGCESAWHKKNDRKIVGEMFWEQVDRRGIDECWPWMGRPTKDGYGAFCCSIGEDRYRDHRTNRLAFFLHFGVIIPGIFILHQCNNRKCCNPSHLYPGTHAQNRRDMAEANTIKGEGHHNHKLTNKAVLEIRMLYSTGNYYHRQLAERYGVSSSTISHAVTMKQWSHI